MKKYLLLLLSLTLITMYGCGSKSTAEAEAKEVDMVAVLDAALSRITHVKAPYFKAMLDKDTDPHIVDVRTPQEFASGHLDGSVNIDISQPGFEEALKQLDKDRTIYVYCAAGGRSTRAAALLGAGGFEVVNMQDGMTGWQGAGFEVVK
ncbi:MAG: rhodanese-like domain-containing protein [Cyclobacteriaceae bacterium]